MGQVGGKRMPGHPRIVRFQHTAFGLPDLHGIVLQNGILYMTKIYFPIKK